MRGRRIDELANIEFRGSLGEAFLDYGEVLQELGRMWKFELEVAARDAEAAMASLHGHPLLFGLDVRFKARQVAKRLKRAQDMAHRLQQCGDKFHRSYRKHFFNRAHNR